MANWKTDERGALQLKLDPSSWRALVRETQCSVELGEAHVNIVRPHELLLTTTHLILATECAPLLSCVIHIFFVFLV